jgi:hypothetical protein
MRGETVLVDAINAGFSLIEVSKQSLTFYPKDSENEATRKADTNINDEWIRRI